MLTFQAMAEPTFGFIESLQVTENDRYLSFLPLSHGMERWLGGCIPFVSGCHVFYTDSLKTFAQDLKRCRPTIFVSVPRLWTKYVSCLPMLALCVSLCIAHFGFTHLILLSQFNRFQQGVFKNHSPRKLKTLMKIPIVCWIVKKKVLKALGLECVRFAASGSAPLPPDLLAWYRNLGLELLEGYGMTENFNCVYYLDLLLKFYLFLEL